jgi:UDP-glucose 4-epimerase
MQVTVTGGAGFIGANLCRRLVAHDAVDRVVVLDDLSTGSLDNLAGLDVELVEGSLLDPADVDRSISGTDAVVHLGARPSVPRSLQDPVASHDANATGTVNVLEAARRAGGPVVVVASSSSVYGANPTLPKHEGLTPMPVSPYAASKLAAEAYALAYQRSFGLPTLAFRFFNVFGPLQLAGHAYAAVIPAFVDAALRGEPLPVHGDGTQSRDFTFVDTVTEVLADAVVRPVTSDGPVNLAFGTRTDLNAVIVLLEDLLGRELPVATLPSRAGDVPHSQADNSALRALFPDVVPIDLRDGLAATVEWMASVQSPSA